VRRLCGADREEDVSEIGVGLIGAGLIGDQHALAFQRVKGATVVAVADPDTARAQRLAATYGIPIAYDDYRRVLEDGGVDVVCVGAPNYTHCEIVLAAADAGKHVICEKPLARTMSEALEMIAAAESAGIKLMYAELICFAPRYVRAKELMDEGAFGRVFQIKHGESHYGPHSDWFWRGELSGGGVLMDMGCHSIEVIRWLYDKPAIASVTAELGTFVHGDRTDLEDHALVTIRFGGNRLGIIEASWAKPGGMDDRLDIQGSAGTCHGDMMRQSSLFTYSDVGYGYSVEKGSTTGYSFTIAEEYYNYGMPQEMQHFTDCVLNNSQPMETGRDGLVSLEVIYAAYRSAATGRRITLPLELTADEAADGPYLLWSEGNEAPE
jgi:myo-inositol 2-dehydrogenase/D-chiro-inositol 1-dehydrogenase